MFRSIFLEGLGRPHAGVRLILKQLVETISRLGGELKLRTGVQRLIVDDGRVTGVKLEDGAVIEGERVLSSAGLPETMRLCGDDGTRSTRRRPASSASAKRSPRSMSNPKRSATTARSRSSTTGTSLRWKKPDAPCDLRSGVICTPNNFRLRRAARRRHDAHHGPRQLRLLERTHRQQLTSSKNFAGTTESPSRPSDSSPTIRRHVIDTDMFTPTTITRFTGRTGARSTARRKSASTARRI